MRIFEKIKDLPYNTIQGISNLFLWIRVIWNDRQWDHVFIYEIFRHKLHLTEQYIRKYGHHTNNISDANRIRKCVLLLDRLINEDYHDNVFSSHYEKWGELELTDKGISYPNVKTEEDEKKEREERKIKYEKENKLREQDLDMLFSIMRKHIQSWWD